MGRTKIIASLTLSLALIGALALWSMRNRGIRVGSKNFTEQVVLGEIIAQHLEHRLHQTVERRLNLGGTLLAHGALLNKEIDLYPEYTGTALTAILKELPDNDPARVLARVRSEYINRFHVDWLDPLGIDNTFAMVVSGPDARARHLENLTDASRLSSGWALGVGYEFQQRPDGLAALDRTYHLRWTGSPKSMDLGLLYKALEGNQVTMIAANATDGLLSKLDLKVLADDQHAFPPYQVSIAAGEERLRETPGMREALQELSGKFTNQAMQQLNYQVDGEHRPVSQVAAEFLKQAGLQ
ncbi:MAG: Substrate-binding region of ABC-type glycine betaine transport system [Bryobacterales bacterium]|nr:Substrate-binding region of ABC-type glycine betaine transport system [Bryobacterales bacterium]